MRLRPLATCLLLVAGAALPRAAWGWGQPDGPAVAGADGKGQDPQFSFYFPPGTGAKYYDIFLRRVVMGKPRVYWRFCDGSVKDPSGKIIRSGKHAASLPTAFPPTETQTLAGQGGDDWNEGGGPVNKPVPAAADAECKLEIEANRAKKAPGGTPLTDMKPSGHNVHGTMLLKAIDILAADGKSDAVAFYETQDYRFFLMSGLHEEDSGGGRSTFLTSGIAFDDNSHSHFYDRARRTSVYGPGLVMEGVVAEALQTTCDPNWLVVLGVGFLVEVANALTPLPPLPPGSAAPVATAAVAALTSWQSCTLVGPHLDAASLASMHYARAVDAMRKKDPYLAMRYLGRAIHLLQDATQPQHVTNDAGIEMEVHHRQFEDLADALLEANQVAHATSGGFYPAGRPHEAIDKAAVDCGTATLRKGAPYADTDDEKPAVDAIKKVIPYGERITAAMLDRFFRTWRTEDFAVVTLTIDRVDARQAGLDGGTKGQADLFPRVTMRAPPVSDRNAYEDRGTRARMYLSGANDVKPNSGYSPTLWVFPQWLYRQSDAIDYQIEIWDDDGGWPGKGGGNEQADLSSAASAKTLTLRYLGTGEVQELVGNSIRKKVTSSGQETLFHAEGTDPRTEIWVKLERFPRPPEVAEGTPASYPIDPSTFDQPDQVCLPNDPVLRKTYIDGLNGIAYPGLEQGQAVPAPPAIPDVPAPAGGARTKKTWAWGKKPDDSYGWMRVPCTDGLLERDAGGTWSVKKAPLQKVKPRPRFSVPSRPRG